MEQGVLELQLLMQTIQFVVLGLHMMRKLAAFAS
jgi:hypothetical protein